jgi:predicted choloylglycine hydrolase
MRYLEFAGTPYEIGLQQGRLCRNYIVPKVHEYMTWFDRDWGGTEQVLRPIYDRLRANAEVMYPDLLAEMDGVADGSRLSSCQIVLFSHYAYLWGTLGLQAQADSCSAVGFAETSDGPLVGQNMDVGPGRHYIELTRPTTGYAVLSDGWYGMPWGESAINEHGLAIGTSHLGARQYLADWETGVNVHFYTRLTLRNCRNVAEGIQFLRETGPMIPLTHGKNYLLVDAEGDMAVVERTQNTAAVRREHCGAMAIANVPLHPEMAATIADRTTAEAASIANSRARHDRVLERWAEAGGEGSLALLKQVMRSHEMPGALCRHAGSDPTGFTRFSIITLPQKRQLMVTDGPPCMRTYEIYGM